MLNTNLPPWPVYSDDEISAVTTVLRSGQVNQWTGSQVENFNTEFAAWAGSDYGIGLANGSLALEAALKACKIGPGDEVIVTPRTFVASVSSVILTGATPVFADVDRDSGNITPLTIEPMLTARTKAIIPVHLAGWPCDMSGMIDLVAGRDIAIIEDCAQAHGARHRGRSVGTWGAIGAWSFCQDKIMSTGGEGGAVTTNDAALWERMWTAKDHGKDFHEVNRKDHPPGFRWLHSSIGSNWRMLEIQAAIGRIQLRYMNDWTLVRQRNAAVLHQAVDDAGCVARAPLAREGDIHAYYRFYAYVEPDALASGWSRDRIIFEAGKLGLPLYQGSCSEVYLEAAFDRAPGRPAQRLPRAAELGETSLMALVHPTIDEASIGRCAEILADVLARARR